MKSWRVMPIINLLLAFVFLIYMPANAYEPKGSQIKLDTSNFDGNLGEEDDDIQKALEALDQAVGGEAAGLVDDGQTIRLRDQGDNVGIGTTQPTSKLDVKGSGKISETFSVSGEGISYIDGEHSGIELDALTHGAIRFKSGGEATNINNGILDLNLESRAGKAIWTSPTNVVGSVPITEQVWEDGKWTIGSIDVARKVGVEAPQLPGLISFYEFDEKWESTQVVDTKGVNNGTASTNVSSFAAAGLVRGAFSFFNNQVDLGAFVEKPTTGAFCCEFSIKTSSSGAAERWWGNRALNEPKVGYEFARLAGGNFWLSVDIGASNLSVSSVSVINNGQWNHVVGCRGDDGIGKVYVNGSREGSVTTSLAGDIGTGSGNTYAGGTPLSPNNFTGLLDKVRVYNRELSDEEVAILYEEFLHPPEATATVISNESFNVGGNAAINGNIYLTGNVGIGTLAPQEAKLVIVGKGVDEDVNFQSRNSLNENLVTILDSGNVGISTVEPEGKLEVYGPAKLTGGIYAGGVNPLKDFDVQPQLIAFYKLNESGLDTTVADSFGSYPGTASRNTNLLATSGKIDGAFNFSSASFDVIHLVGFPKPTTYVAADFFIKTSSVPQGVMGNRLITGDQNGWGILTRSDHKIQFFIDAGPASFSSIISNTSIDDGNWHHVAVKRDDTVLSMRVDGEPEGTQIGGAFGDMGTSAGEMYIGDYPQSTAATFNGQLDNIRIYASPPSDLTFEALFNNGVGTDKVVQSSVVNFIGDVYDPPDNFDPTGSDLTVKRHVEVKGSTYVHCIMGIDDDGTGLTEVYFNNGFILGRIDTNGVCGE